MKGWKGCPMCGGRGKYKTYVTPGGAGFSYQVEFDCHHTQPKKEDS